MSYWYTTITRTKYKKPAPFKKGQRIQLLTYPGDRYNHRRIRKIADPEPYFKVEDHMGNTGMYQLDQINTNPPPPRKRNENR